MDIIKECNVTWHSVREQSLGFPAHKTGVPTLKPPALHRILFAFSLAR